MPPVMGAAAFLMVEYTDTPYVDVVRHAILPAVITYIALFYIVHLEAVKQNLPSLPRAMTPKPRLWALVSPLATLGVIGAIAGVLYAVFVLLLAVESRSEEHTSDLQSLMRISYAVFCLKKKNKKKQT